MLVLLVYGVSRRHPRAHPLRHRNWHSGWLEGLGGMTGVEPYLCKDKEKIDQPAGCPGAYRG